MTISDEFKLLILALTAVTLLGCIAYVERKISERVPEIFIERPFIPSNIIINTNTEYGPVSEMWKAFAQGGEEPGRRMLYPTVDYMSKIKPAYIRLDHIFDDEYYAVVRGRKADGTLLLNWTLLDNTVSDITATGAKPFLCLSYMPYMIAGSKIGVPNWQDWQDLVRQTIEHYSSKFADVYYEVWNEPSLPSFGTWRMYGPKDYRELYYYAVMGASQAKPIYQFKIGGPAIPELDPKWVTLLFDYVKEKNLRLDFFSWHRYHYDPQQYVLDDYEINVITSEPKYQQFADLEKVITEWGPNSYKDTIYSSQVSASYQVAVIRKLLDKVSMAFSFEIKDGPGQGNYGWGLLSHESAGVYPKPRYYLFDWMADFKGQRLEMLGEGSNVTGFAVKEKRSVSTILTNFNAINPQDESFQITFGQMGGGRYRLLVQKLFDEPVEKEVSIYDTSLVLNINLPAYELVKIQLTKLANFNKKVPGFNNIFYNVEIDKF